jgi:hypothetical protein
MKNMKVLCSITILMLLSACGDKKIVADNGCFIDLINNSAAPMVLLNGGEEVTIGGWVADEMSKTSPEEVAINFISPKGEPYEFAKGKVISPRPDVITALGLAPNAVPGFGLTGKVPKGITPGVYNVQTVGYYPAKIVVCKTAKNIELK